MHSQIDVSLNYSFYETYVSSPAETRPRRLAYRSHPKIQSPRPTSSPTTSHYSVVCHRCSPNYLRKLEFSRNHYHYSKSLWYSSRTISRLIASHSSSSTKQLEWIFTFQKGNILIWNGVVETYLHPKIKDDWLVVTILLEHIAPLFSWSWNFLEIIRSPNDQKDDISSARLLFFCKGNIG